jgi:hypothetical protein
VSLFLLHFSTTRLGWVEEEQERKIASFACIFTLVSCHTLIYFVSLFNLYSPSTTETTYLMPFRLSEYYSFWYIINALILKRCVPASTGKRILCEIQEALMTNHRLVWANFFDFFGRADSFLRGCGTGCLLDWVRWRDPVKIKNQPSLVLSFSYSSRGVPPKFDPLLCATLLRSDRCCRWCENWEGMDFVWSIWLCACLIKSVFLQHPEPLPIGCRLWCWEEVDLLVQRFARLLSLSASRLWA